MPGRVLMIAYYFPPLGGAGVQRSLKFTRYLPAFGWEPTILTVADEPNYVHDPALGTEVPPNTRVIRAHNALDFDALAQQISTMPVVASNLERWRGQRPGTLAQAVRARLRFLEIPDAKMGWILPAFRAGLEFLRTQKIDVIYSTSAPYSSHLVGFLFKLATGLPWVADFRDEWAHNPFVRQPSRLHATLANRLENLVVNTADRVVSVAEPLNDLLQQQKPGASKFSVITNGYDQEDIAAAQTGNGAEKNTRFCLAYAGSFYGLRTPEKFLDALETLVLAGNLPSESVCVQLIGQVGTQMRTRPSLSAVLEMPGYVSHRDALKMLDQSDVLLLVIPREGGARTYPGKIFEYIALRKPILALVPPTSVSARLIRETGTGIVVSPDDAAGIKQAIQVLFTAWQTNALGIRPNDARIERYERRQTTRELAALFDHLVEKKH